MRLCQSGSLLGCALVAWWLLAGCSSGDTASLTDSGGSITPEITAGMPAAAAAVDAGTTAVASTANLEETINSINELAVPGGVDSGLFSELQAELSRVLTARYGTVAGAIGVTGKSASAVDASAWGLQGLMTSANSVSLCWKGRHTGDYNLDGLIGVSDLTPLGVHYNATVQVDGEGLPVVSGDNEWIAAVDGNRDGLVNLSDITAIGQNYNSIHRGYRVYTGIASGGAEVVWSTAHLPGVDPQRPDVTVPFNQHKNAGEVHCYTFSFPKPVLAADDILYVAVMAFCNDAESSPAEAHLIDGPHAVFYCSTCHHIATMDFIGVEETCLTCHPAPPEDATASWDDTPYAHDSCFVCHSNHGWAPDPPETACQQCHSTAEEEAAAAGMPNCLGCHHYAHVPVLQPKPLDCEVCHAGISSQLEGGVMTDCAMCHDHHTFAITYTTESCMVCHPTPPDVTGGTWAQSPGAHNSCFLCHGQHQFRPEDPNELCDTCHSDKAAGTGHGMDSGNCLGCHGNPHVPSAAMDPGSCVDCHATPPEDETLLWADAPGTHGMCEQCHPGPGHGAKPEPAESICGTCHNDLIIAGHAGGSTSCLVCHSYPHVPDFSIGQDDCLICHTNPPEDLAAPWADAPSGHALCLSCHSGTEHGAKPEPPESICADCHGALITGGHAAGYTLCLDCHDQMHLPTVEPIHDLHAGNATCVECHGPSGSDMPDRDTCLACHPLMSSHHAPTICQECHGN